MRKILFGLTLFFCTVSLSAQKKLIEDPNAQLRKLSGSFHAVEVSSAIDLYLSQGEDEAIAVSAAKTEDIAKIITEVDNGVLKIRIQNTGRIFWGSKNAKFRAYVSFKNIDKISGSGATNVYIEGSLVGSNLEVHLSGASDLKGSLKLDNLAIDLSGASDIMVNGLVSKVNVSASGASSMKAFDLVTDNCTAHASGASDIKVTVNKELDVHASGASDVHYKGNAVIKELHTSGASSVAKKD